MLCVCVCVGECTPVSGKTPPFGETPPDISPAHNIVHGEALRALLVFIFISSSVRVVVSASNEQGFGMNATAMGTTQSIGEPGCVNLIS